jgi:hypothetical protein
MKEFNFRCKISWFTDHWKMLCSMKWNEMKVMNNKLQRQNQKLGGASFNEVLYTIIHTRDFRVEKFFYMFSDTFSTVHVTKH